MNKLILTLLLSFLAIPVQVSAIGISKQTACLKWDGLNTTPLYILWKWEIPYVDSFVKYNNKLYYFIHQFRSSTERDIYRKWINSPLTNSGFIISQWSSLVEYDCARSKVNFLPVQDKTGKSYGKILWEKDGYMAYSFIKPNTEKACLLPQDAIYNLAEGKNIDVNTVLEKYPTSDDAECYTRNMMTYLGKWIVKFRVERKVLSKGNSYFFPYTMSLITQKYAEIKKEIKLESASEEDILVQSGRVDEYLQNKKIFSPGITFKQTDTDTMILYHGTVIKTYRNYEFPNILLRSMVTKEPDCANSERSNTKDEVTRNELGKNYLRQCLIQEMRYYPKGYILFFWPSIDGHTISLYDINLKKFFYNIIGTTTQIRFSKGKGILFMVSNPWLYCNSSIWHYKDGKSKKIFDECTLENEWWQHVKINTATFRWSYIDITYKPLIISWDNLLEWSKKTYSLSY